MSDLQDKMEQSDRDVQVSIRCAKCGEAVQPGEEHECKGEKKNEN